jgi:predicted dehydrogenase
VSVFDQSLERLGEAKERFGCTGYTTFDELIADDNVELVIVAMPSSLHAPMSIKALEAGKHVVCEKPMAGNLADAEAMIAAEKASGKTLSIFQNYRYHAGYLKVKEVIDSGVLGRIVQIRIAFHGFARRWDWQTLKKFDGGSMNNTGPHPIDLALQLFGEAEPEVFCVRDKTLTLGDADDHLKLILHGAGSPTCEVEVTSACAFGQDKWLVMGTQGGLSGTDNAIKWKYFNPDELESRTVLEEPTVDRKYCSEQLPMQECEWTKETDRNCPGEEVYYDEIYQCIRNGAAVPVTPASVLRQMRIMQQARQLSPV